MDANTSVVTFKILVADLKEKYEAFTEMSSPPCHMNSSQGNV